MTNLGSGTATLLPKISVIIPTYNSSRVIDRCLESIAAQDYPSERIEIIIADAGSSDGTREIAKNYTRNVLPNPLRTAEAGKAVGFKSAGGDILAFIDSDNVLPGRDWMRRMVEPFMDPGIIATEPLEFTHRSEDGFITRYCALLGMNDPLCLFLGNYDRYCYITDRWTGLRVEAEDKGRYLKVRLGNLPLPTVGANGFLIRRRELERCKIGDYLFDIDILYELMAISSPLFVAKVKTGIVHIFSGSVYTFIKKQRRRVRDFFYFSSSNMRKYPWGSMNRFGIVKFLVYCGLVLPLFWQCFRGWRRKPETAWLFHPVACWITLWVYGIGVIQGLFIKKMYSREDWSQ